MLQSKWLSGICLSTVYINLSACEFFSALIFCNWTHFEFQDHIVVHKPKISVSNLALGGESSGIELVGGDESSNVKCTVGYQVNKKK